MNFLKPKGLLLTICAPASVVAAAVAFFASERLSHLEDEVGYLYQAKTMALRPTQPSSPRIRIGRCTTCMRAS